MTVPAVLVPSLAWAAAVAGVPMEPSLAAAVSLSDTQLTIILAAIPGVIGALANWRKSKSIETHVNSMNTALSDKLSAANQQIALLIQANSGLVQQRETKAAAEVVLTAAAMAPAFIPAREARPASSTPPHSEVLAEVREVKEAVGSVKGAIVEAADALHELKK